MKLVCFIMKVKNLYCISNKIEFVGPKANWESLIKRGLTNLSRASPTLKNLKGTPRRKEIKAQSSEGRPLLDESLRITLSFVACQEHPPPPNNPHNGIEKVDKGLYELNSEQIQRPKEKSV